MPGSAVPCGNGGRGGGRGCFCLWHPSAQLSRSFLHTHRLWEGPTSKRKHARVRSSYDNKGQFAGTVVRTNRHTLQNAAKQAVTEPKDNENVSRYLLCIWKMCSSFLTSAVKLLTTKLQPSPAPPNMKRNPDFWILYLVSLYEVIMFNFFELQILVLSKRFSANDHRWLFKPLCF